MKVIELWIFQKKLTFLIISSLFFLMLLYNTSAQTNSTNITSINLTCPVKSCTTIIIEIKNETFIPFFKVSLPGIGINCTMVPIQTGVLATSKHQMICEYPLLNFSSQEVFDKSITIVPIEFMKAFQNISTDYADYQKVKSELPIWQAIAFIAVGGIVVYLGWNEWQQGKS